jgi:hypothetical protein
MGWPFIRMPRRTRIVAGRAVDAAAAAGPGGHEIQGTRSKVFDSDICSSIPILMDANDYDGRRLWRMVLLRS